MGVANRTQKLAASFLLVMAVAAAQALAREAENPEGVAPVRRLIVKRYIPLTPSAVWKTADAGTAQADVRFTDAFQRALPAPNSVRTVRVGDKRYRIAMVVQTESDLSCLVPIEQRDTIEKIAEFREAQQITVEGTVIGVVGMRRSVLVDRILSGDADKSIIKHELLLSWPGTGQKVKSIQAPGEYTVEFPCRYAQGKVETFFAVITQRNREDMKALLKARAQEAAEKGDDKEKKAPPKQYTTYRAENAYKYAVTGQTLNVRFKDTIKGPAVGSKRRHVRDVPRGLQLLRLRGVPPLRIAVAFDTYIGLTCVIPERNEKLVAQADRILPGQEITIKGTIVRPLGTYKLVVVDDIEFPEGIGEVEAPDVWVVTIFWDPQTPKIFYESGSYSIMFDCRHVEGRKEQLQAELREVREILGEVKKEDKPKEGEPDE